MQRQKSPGSRGSLAGITRYLQLYTHLAQELADGRFLPGQALPSEPDLVRQHGLSRTTVRRALDRLEREGRIVRRRGSGTYAREKKNGTPLALDLREFCDPQSQVTTQKNLQSGVAPVSPGLQSRYPMLGAQARFVKRLRMKNGEACRLESVYYCSGAGTRGTRIETAKHELCAVTADPFAARHLGVIAGAPLLRIRTEFSTKGGDLVAVAENLMRCDRAILEVSLAPYLKRARGR